ncbi:MAG: isoprenyl transferase [Bradymonadia bacterium]
MKARTRPRHLAIIMDGNGRWALERGLPRVEGHRVGADAVHRTVRACRELGLSHLTLYAFSEQNWRRPEEEVQALMRLLLEYVRKERAEILDNDIRLNTIGQVDRLPAFVRGPLRELMERSAGNRGMVLTLALSYGGREELVQAARRVAARVLRGELELDDVDEDTLASGLDTHDLPDPDLLIRTSGEERISNFLLWQLAYTELYFTNVPWPEFDRPHLLAAFEHFAQRERRFGLTSAQVDDTAPEDREKPAC